MMGKPRTNWTGLKHFGTFLWSPVKYYRYKQHRDQFVQQDHLALHALYANEVTGPVHPYPGTAGTNARLHGVIYPGQAPNEAQTRINNGTNLMTNVPFEHQTDSGV